MINIQFNIRNPFSNRFEIIKCWHGPTLFKNKFWEFQIDRTAEIVGFDFKVTTRQDHAGLYLGLALVGFDIIFNFYDCRHWDAKSNCYEILDQ